MQFIDPATRETFEVPQGWPSERRRALIGAASVAKNKELADLASKYTDVQEAQKLDKAAQAKRFNEDLALTARTVEYGELMTEIANRANRLSCRATLEVRDLTPERRAMIEQDVNSEFWLEQSVPAVEEAVERFRKSLTRGQRGDQPDSRVAGVEPAAATTGAAEVPGGEAEVGDGAGA